MKKLISLLCAFALLVFCFGGCKNEKAVVIDGDYVVITVEIENIDEGGTLKEYMDYLQAKGELRYEMQEGMIISINGKKGSSNEYWILYTSDRENAENSWGTCVYKDTTYDSAKVGADTLVVKDGCTYIWHLQTF